MPFPEQSDGDPPREDLPENPSVAMKERRKDKRVKEKRGKTSQGPDFQGKVLL